MRRAASWSIDFAIGLTIFIVAIVLGVSLVTNYAYDDEFNDVRITGNAIAEDLVSPGFPAAWTPETAVVLGLSSGNRLDIGKYVQFTAMQYSEAKKLLSSPYDFYVLIRNATGVLNISGCGYGHPSVSVGHDCEPQFPPANDLTITRRIIIVGAELSEMDVYAWH